MVGQLYIIFQPSKIKLVQVRWSYALELGLNKCHSEVCDERPFIWFHLKRMPRSVSIDKGSKGSKVDSKLDFLQVRSYENNSRPPNLSSLCHRADISDGYRKFNCISLIWRYSRGFILDGWKYTIIESFNHLNWNWFLVISDRESTIE